MEYDKTHKNICPLKWSKICNFAWVCKLLTKMLNSLDWQSPLFQRCPEVAQRHAPPPDHYACESGSCWPFFPQCSLVSRLQSSSFPKKWSKLAYVIMFWAGKARKWGSLGLLNVTTFRPLSPWWRRSLKKVSCHPTACQHIPLHVSSFNCYLSFVF